MNVLIFRHAPTLSLSRRFSILAVDEHGAGLAVIMEVNNGSIPILASWAALALFAESDLILCMLNMLKSFIHSYTPCFAQCPPLVLVEQLEMFLSCFRAKTRARMMYTQPSARGDLQLKPGGSTPDNIGNYAEIGNRLDSIFALDQLSLALVE